MSDDDDKELERIRAKRMQELMKIQDQPPPPPAPTTPVDISDTDFRSFISENPVAVVDCWAPWCGPCKMLAPVLHELAQEFASVLVIGKLNTDENPLVASSFGIKSIPTILFFKDGNLVDRHVGVAPKPLLVSKIKTIIGDTGSDD